MNSTTGPQSPDFLTALMDEGIDLSIRFEQIEVGFWIKPLGPKTRRYQVLDIYPAGRYLRARGEGGTNRRTIDATEIDHVWLYCGDQSESDS